MIRNSRTLSSLAGASVGLILGAIIRAEADCMHYLLVGPGTSNDMNVISVTAPI